MSRRNAKKRPSAAEQLKQLRENPDADLTEPAPPAANQTPPPGETTPAAGDGPTTPPNETPPDPSGDPLGIVGTVLELNPPPEPPPSNTVEVANLARFKVPLADVPEGVYVSRHV